MDEIVTVTGTGEASSTPDVLRLRLRVEGRGADVGEALDTASAALGQVLEVVRAHGVADRDIASGRISVGTRYNQNGARVGFESTQEVAITVRDVAASGALMRAAAAAAPDALSIDDVALAIAEPGPLLVAARDAAFADAKARAEQYARLARRRLGAVLQISEDRGHSVPIARMARESVAFAAAAVPVEAGEESLRASITVAWQLLD